MLILLLVCAFVSVGVAQLWQRLVPQRRLELRGKHVVVVGGSEGIGLACAAEAIRRGAAAVTVLSRSVEKLKAAGVVLAAEKGLSGNQGALLRAFACDAANPDSVVKVFGILSDPRGGHGKERQRAGSVEGFGGGIGNNGKLEGPLPAVDVVVCAAGVCVCDRLTDLSDAELGTVLQTNLMTALLPVREWFRARQTINEVLRPGAVVLFGSQASHVGIYGFSAYSCAKFGLRGLWEVLLQEGKKLNVNVHCAFPPNTDTPGFKVENIRKPPETRRIEDVGGLLTAKQVAKVVMSAVESGKRRITFGIVGFLLAATSSGLSPCDGWLQLLGDLCMAPIGRLVGVALTIYWHSLL